jgi:lysozyme
MNQDLLIADLIRDEKLALKPYHCTAGRLTVGIGRNLDDVGLTPDEAKMLCANDIARIKGELDRAVPWWRKMSEARQRGLANMCFNLGLARLLGFRKMLTALEADDWQAAAREALSSKWAEQVGKRANRIAALFMEG